jgi:hypothetical protein
MEVLTSVLQIFKPKTILENLVGEVFPKSRGVDNMEEFEELSKEYLNFWE